MARIDRPPDDESADWLVEAARRTAEKCMDNGDARATTAALDVLRKAMEHQIEFGAVRRRLDEIVKQLQTRGLLD